MNRRDPGHLEARTAAGAFVLAAAVLVIALIAGASVARSALLAFVPLALGAGAMFAAWRRAADRNVALEASLRKTHDDVTRAAARRTAAEATVEDVRSELEDAGAEAERRDTERERLQRTVRRAEEELGRQRELMRRLAQSRRAEREWNRELRGQLQRLYDAQRTPSADEHSDVRDLVLQTAIKLVEAPKGMLLSREDADGDGALDVVVSHGFEHDPSDSEVAQRFARQVLRSDEIVREDEPVADGESASDADGEIETLVAVPLYLRDRFHGVIICANRPGGFDDMDDDVLLALGDHAGAALHHGQLHNELNEAQHAALRALLEVMAARDLRLHRESTGLTLHALALARDLELDPGERDVLVCATLLRHVGHVAVPDRLLLTERALRPDERAVIELHPRVGFNVIGQVPALRDVAAAVLYHHEWFDGTGYPAGLAGETIPVAARALAALEAYAAMTNDRPYRERRSLEEACDELIAGAGTQFDPEIVQLLVEEVRSGPLAVDEALADRVVEALPLNLAGRAGAAAGPLAAASTDGLTLLGNQRALHNDLRDAVAAGRPFAVVLVQLEDLAAVNDDVGYAAGDHLIQVAARNAQRAAARFGGTAYRASGRRLAILAPVDGREAAGELVNELMIEFVGGSAVRTSRAVWAEGDRPVDVLGRARDSVMRATP
jgi:HD-GYP domain-containing protein (c-di-GMP phosphodiesterase class II)